MREEQVYESKPITLLYFPTLKIHHWQRLSSNSLSPTLQQYINIAFYKGVDSSLKDIN